MSESEDRIELELGMPVDEMRVPPERFAVPATAMPLLPVDELVTLGEPGRWWAVDAAYVASPPWTDEAGEERYGLVTLGELSAIALRDQLDPGREKRGKGKAVQWPTRDLWVYRDADSEQLVTDLPLEASQTAWFDRMPADDLTPPPSRSPRPARELPSLLGQRLRVLANGAWTWVVAVSEPLQMGEAISVRVVTPVRLAHLMGGEPMPEGQPFLVALHRLWVY